MINNLQAVYETRGPLGPGSLTCILVTRRGCKPETINPISPTPTCVSPSWVSVSS